MATSIDQLDLLELPIEDRAFGADPEPWFAKAREKHPWLAKFSHGYLVHGHHEIRDLLRPCAVFPGMQHDGRIRRGKRADRRGANAGGSAGDQDDSLDGRHGRSSKVPRG